MAQREKNVRDLVHLLDQNKYLHEALETSLQKAQEPGMETLEQFYDYLDNILTHIPSEKELMPSVRKFYFVISHAPDDMLKKDEAFNTWMNDFVISRGDFMDTAASAETLDSFIENPEYKIDDYFKGPSGWLTYNQFLGRQLKPGKRPIAGKCDDKIIVSPADSEFKGLWTIADNSTVTVKGTSYCITDLLETSGYKHKFKNGIFTHSFLAITDYHWFHAPVNGIIREVKNIPGTTWIHEAKKPDGSIENTDDVGFQFTHTRGHIIIESSIGYVAIMPVGMGHISSVNFTVDEGAELTKGEEFGFFAFGGSDIIMLFEQDRVQFSAKEKTHYKMGEQIAVSISDSSTH